MPERQRMTTRLKALFQQPELFVLAGGINPIGAKMAEALGYDAFYMSGGNTSAHQLGWPDSGTSMRDMVDNARKIVLTVDIPVFADADTGYGFLWRLYSYWRFEERDTGVVVECRAISLTRNVPFGLGWAIEPMIEKLPKESLIKTLEATRQALQTHDTGNE